MSSQAVSSIWTLAKVSVVQICLRGWKLSIQVGAEHPAWSLELSTGFPTLSQSTWSWHLVTRKSRNKNLKELLQKFLFNTFTCCPDKSENWKPLWGTVSYQCSYSPPLPPSNCYYLLQKLDNSWKVYLRKYLQEKSVISLFLIEYS